MIHRFFLAAGFLALVLPLSACSKTVKAPAPQVSAGSPLQTDRMKDHELVMQRLGPLTSLLESMELFPKSYTVKIVQTTGKTKVEIFQQWLDDKLKNVDKRMHEEILEWLEYKTYLNSRQARQEEVGLLRDPVAINETADNFYFADTLEPEEIEGIRKRLTDLKKSGIEFGYNGFDLKGCGETEDTRQTDDYVVSPLLIEPATGRVFEFQYRGGCWD